MSEARPVLPVRFLDRVHAAESLGGHGFLRWRS